MKSKDFKICPLLDVLFKWFAKKYYGKILETNLKRSFDRLKKIGFQIILKKSAYFSKNKKAIKNIKYSIF